MFTPTLSQIQPIVEKYGTPMFLTSEELLRDRVKVMKETFAPLGGKVFFAMKTNFNPSVTKVLKEAGIDGIDAVAPYEIELGRRLGFTPEQIMFTGSNSSTEEIEWVGKQGVIQNLGSISELRRFAKLFPGNSPPLQKGVGGISRMSLRLCPEVTAGESDKVKTGHSESKFGITLEELDEAQKIINEYNLELAGLHIHIGSGFYDPRDMARAVQVLANVAKAMKPTQFIDIGGGYGVSYHPDKPGLDLTACAELIKPILDDLTNTLGRKIELRLEPGKFLTTHSTALLVTVTTIKQKGGITFVGVDSGFNHLIRPVMYGSYHHIVNVSGEARIHPSLGKVARRSPELVEGRRRDGRGLEEEPLHPPQREPPIKSRAGFPQEPVLSPVPGVDPGSMQESMKMVRVVGYICESGDVLNESIELTDPQEGDVLAILCAGSYGASMSSFYNLRPRAREALLKTDGTFIETKRPETLDEIMGTYTEY